MSKNGKGDAVILEQILTGMQSKPKQLPSSLFYDEPGSELFNKITELDEYYLTRTEIKIMSDNIDSISKQCGDNVLLIEFGSGSSVKTRLLLDKLKNPAGYIPVDISADHLLKTTELLKNEYRDLNIYPLVHDFTKEFVLPETDISNHRRLVYFPGSTIGNFTPEETNLLLKRIAKLCRSGGMLLIGIDLVKDIKILESAYNDSLGVTAEFNINILRHLNNMWGTDFNISEFKHHAFFNKDARRIEMHLISRKDQTVHLNDITFEIKKNEPIVTEYSYKYTMDQFFSQTSPYFNPRQYWTDKCNYFAVVLVEAKYH